jgi:lipopolysaccharide transport system ATP-binding protein
MSSSVAPLSEPVSREVMERDVPAPRDAADAIQVRGVSKTYDLYRRPQDRLWRALFGRRRVFHTEFTALHDVSFDVRRGETVGIIGVNGSGKSTLLQIVCGTLAPTAGAVRTSGRVAALLELGTGFDPAFTGRENVHLNAAMLGLTRAEVDARFDRIAAFADIGSFIDRPVMTYSSGMVVRLAFAVIANVDADVLVIDEALAVGDVFFVQKCMRFLRAFMARGTVLFVSHDAGAVAALCDRAIWLHDGRLIIDDRAALVADTYLECLAEQAWGGEAGEARAGEIRRTAAARIAERAAARDAGDERVDAAPPVPPPQAEGELALHAVDVTGPSFGEGGARIVDVALLDAGGQPVRVVRGGDGLTLSVRAETRDVLDAPIIGFVVKDRLGQALFGENTFERYLGRAPRLEPGQTIEARFSFAAPILAPGDYAISVAVADGTQNQHIQHHWIHDAVVFRSVTRSVATGLMGIPMQDVTLRRLPGALA